MAFILVGAYCMNNSLFDVARTVFFGFIGYFMKKLEYPTAPFVWRWFLARCWKNPCASPW
jgi:putative tricarboxylic transport membrane protein